MCKLQDLIMFFEFPIGMQKNIFKIYKQLGNAPSKRFASSGLWGSCGKHNRSGVGTDTRSGVILVSRLNLNLKLTFEVLRKP
jgi:hypothetical protein